MGPMMSTYFCLRANYWLYERPMWHRWKKSTTATISWENLNISPLMQRDQSMCPSGIDVPYSGAEFHSKVEMLKRNQFWWIYHVILPLVGVKLVFKPHMCNIYIYMCVIFEYTYNMYIYILLLLLLYIHTYTYLQVAWIRHELHVFFLWFLRIPHPPCNSPGGRTPHVTDSKEAREAQGGIHGSSGIPQNRLVYIGFLYFIVWKIPKDVFSFFLLGGGVALFFYETSVWFLLWCQYS